MKSKQKLQYVSLRAVVKANAKLVTNGITSNSHKGGSGTVTVHIERGSLNHQRVVSREEISRAYRAALTGNV
jgi:hypothetical protein